MLGNLPTAHEHLQGIRVASVIVSVLCDHLHDRTGVLNLNGWPVTPLLSLDEVDSYGRDAQEQRQHSHYQLVSILHASF